MNIANQYGAEVIEHEDFIGGRYSVLSEAGMFPAALMGLKLNKFKTHLEIQRMNQVYYKYNSLFDNDKVFIYTLFSNYLSSTTMGKCWPT